MVILNIHSRNVWKIYQHILLYSSLYTINSFYPDSLLPQGCVKVGDRGLASFNLLLTCSSATYPTSFVRLLSLSTYLTIYLSVSIYLHSSIHPSISIYLSISLYLSNSFCQFLSLSVSLSLQIFLPSICILYLKSESNI